MEPNSPLVLLIAGLTLVGIVPPIGGIFGGFSEDITNAPWIVSLSVTRTGLICGGVLVTNQWVLTAAYCVFMLEPADITLRLGSDNANKGGSTATVTQIVTHKQFNPMTKDYNLALLKLRYQLQESSTIKSIKFVNPAEGIKTDTSCMIYGYGSSNDKGGTLKAATVNIMDRNKCNRNLSPLSVTNTMICAKGNNQDGCAGDAGGPLTCGGKLAGIISWGKGCGQGDGTGVYADVNSDRNWIAMNAGL